MDGGKIVMLSVAATMLLTTARLAAAPSEAASPAPSLQASLGQTQTGIVTGKVRFEGKAPKRAIIKMDQDPVCAAKHAELPLAEDGAVNPDGSLPYVFVYVKDVPGTFAPPAEPVILDQHGCQYEPHVLGVMAGQELRIVSSDATTHNIHPMPKDNREWNQSQPPGAAPLVKKFVHPEIMIPVKCNQHPWMKAYIGVVSNPLYAVTASEGTFTIKGLQPGEYTVEAWTATFGTREQKVTVRANESAMADFTFEARQ
jgi:plastocyanin